MYNCILHYAHHQSRCQLVEEALVAQAVLSVRMDEETKRAFADFCDQIGMSVSTAINMFARQTLREQRLPFIPSLGMPNTPAAFDSGPGFGSPTEVPVTLSRLDIAKAVERAAAPFVAIDRVVLFGSHARGDARPDSDIDLRVVRATAGVLTCANIAAFSEAVGVETGRGVDVVSARVIKDEALAAAIEREGVVVYER